MHVQSCCLANLNLLLFAVLVDVAVVIAYAPCYSITLLMLSSTSCARPLLEL